MRKIKLLSVAIIALALIAMFSILIFAAGSDTVTCSTRLDKPAVCGDKEDVVTLTIGIDKADYVVQSIEFAVIVPEGWTVVSATNEALTFDSGINEKGQPLYNWFDLENATGVAIDYVAKVAVKVPAGIATGEYKIAISEVEVLDEDFQNVSIAPEMIEATVKVGHTKGAAVVENDVAPDCTNKGSYDNVVYCAVCDKELSRVTVPVNEKGHTKGGIVVENTVAPDCTNKGSYDNVVYCTVCETELSRDTVYINEKGHTEGKVVVENEVAPDCTNKGSYDNVVYCTVCKTELSRVTVPVDEKGHTAGAVVVENQVAPDCTNKGSYDNVVYCTVCKTELSRVTVPVDEKGHTRGGVVVENQVAPDCTNKGSYDNVVYCIVCEAEISRDTVYIKENGHTEGEVVVENQVAPDCTNKGSYDNVVYCTVCEAEISRDTVYIKENGHTEGETVVENNIPVSCTANGSYDNVVYCTVCKAELSRETVTVKSEGHDYKSTVTPSTCNKAGYTTYTCSVCDDTYKVDLDLDPAKHAGTEVTYTNNGDTHSAAYNCCGAAYITDEAHAYDETTAICICGASNIYTITVYGMDGKTVVYTASVIGGTSIFATVDKNAINGYYGEGISVVEIDGAYAALWGEDDATMPTADVEWKAYWSGFKTDSTGTQYIAKNEVAKGWFTDGSNYYYADPTTGYCAAGTVRAQYPTMKIDGTVYAPNAADIAYAEGKGIAFIDKDEAWFVFGADGRFQSTLTGIEDGKYVKRGMVAWYTGPVVDDGETYYFVADSENGGNKLANGDVWVTRTNGVASLIFGACYNFKDGKLSGQSGIVSGKYYVDSKLELGAGLVKYGESYIYVRSNGNVVMNASYYVPENTYVVYGSYDFDENGYMINPNTNFYNGVVEGSYYVNGKIAYAAGLLEWNGSVYYVRSNGEVAIGKYYVTNVNDMEGYELGQRLYFDKAGKLVVDESIIDGYYYVNGKIAYGAGLVEVGGDIYYIRTDGKVATGEYYISKVNGMKGFEPGQRAYFGKDGRLIGY